MSDIKELENIIFVGAIGVGAFLAWQLYQDIRPTTKAVGEGVGDIVTETATDVTKIESKATVLAVEAIDIPQKIVETGQTTLGVFGIGSSYNTVGLGDNCHMDSECSLTGVPGGLNARLSDPIGCCSGVCEEKVDRNGIYWCKPPTKPVGQKCDLDSECSKTGIPRGEPAGFFDEIGCCGGRCQNKVKGFLGAKWCPAIQN